MTRTHHAVSTVTGRNGGRRFPGALPFIAIVLLLSLLPAGARAERLRFQLDLGDSVYVSGRGCPVVLPLKRLLHRQYPGIHLRHMEVKRVVLLAKSKWGGGRAALRVGSNLTRKASVDGSPDDFWRDGRRTWDKVRFFNPSERSRGPWQIYLYGKIKVRKVVVVVEKRDRGRHACRSLRNTDPRCFVDGFRRGFYLGPQRRQGF